LHTAEQRTSWFVYLLVVLCVAMTTANVYLLRDNRSLRSARAEKSTEVTIVGKVVNTVTGLDLNDRPVTIATSGKKATVIMAYSPVCPYCEKNWSNWSALITRVPNQSVNFVTVDLTGMATPEFLSKKQPGRARTIHKMDPEEMAELNLIATPETIVIGSDSKVKRVWAGVLSADDIAVLNKLLI
jgi:hypothetical protein